VLVEERVLMEEAEEEVVVVSACAQLNPTRLHLDGGSPTLTQMLLHALPVLAAPGVTRCFEDCALHSNGRGR